MTFKCQIQGNSGFEGLYLVQKLGAGFMLLLNIIQESYTSMRSPATPLHLTLSDLEGQIQGRAC